MVAERALCSGFRDNIGYVQAIEECSDACKGKKRSMFTYARADKYACNSLGCFCYCEASVTEDGRCTQGTTYDENYDLYKFIWKILVVYLFILKYRVI